MLKKDIKSYFLAIRHFDLETVKALVASDSAYLTACSSAPPKKDDGQSGLQVALKIGALDIADFLVESGADVNFMEKSSVNEWRAPVLHDAIMRTIFSCVLMEKDSKVFDHSLSLLGKMLEKGANPNARDSLGNSCLGRALLDSKQLTVSHPRFMQTPSMTMKDGKLVAYESQINKNLTDAERELELSQLRRVFKLLIDYGAYPDDASDPRRQSACTDVRNFGMEDLKLL
ncbi:MAG: ankyrin repeat domain-containing protein [Streptococcaceae bacterium]|nr:ankyrin repeat domain-containing protein [Streptococcaceae bacterium]